MMNESKTKKYIRTAMELGADRAKIIPASAVTVAEWVLMKCRYGCDGYGTGHLCPPRTPAPEETKRMLTSYSTAMVLTFDHIMQSHRPRRQREHRKLVFDLERMLFLDGYYKAFGMGCGPCCLCDSCNPDEPCRNPEIARPAMEACGIDVYQTMSNAGWKLRIVQKYGDPMTMVGLVLME